MACVWTQGELTAYATVSSGGRQQLFGLCHGVTTGGHRGGAGQGPHPHPSAGDLDKGE